MTIQEIAFVMKVEIVEARDVYNRAFVAVRGLEIKHGDVLEAAVGRGDTKRAARVDLCRQLSGRRVVARAMSEGRAEMDVPHRVTWQR